MVEKIGWKSLNFDLEKLKTELMVDIKTEFAWNEKISDKTIENLLNLKTINSLDWLKSELNDFKNEINSSDKLSILEKKSLQNLSEDEKNKLFNVLKWYKNVIEKASRDKLDILKDTLENWNSQDKTWLERRLPVNILNKLENPNWVWDEVLWIALWTTNSIMTTVEFLYKLWAWIIKSPYHIYLIVSWKAKYEIPNI